MNTKYTISAFAEDSPGVLYRIANLFLRRQINIHSLTVCETEQANISRFTIVVYADAATIEKLVKQLYRIIEISRVFESVDDQIISREVVLVKVTAENGAARREIIDIATLYEAVIAHVEKDYILIQKTSEDSKIDSLIELLRPYGIKEVVRSGRIALRK